MDTYKKKYKESMAKMSTFLAKHDGFTISKDGEMYKELTEIFPELKESEDERTWLINYLSNRILNSSIIPENENLKKAIAWLEKQGEQKPNPCDGCINRKGCINCENGELREVEQKTAEWSEEDEKIYEKALDAVYYFDDNDAFENKKILAELCDWIGNRANSLRPQKQWKPSDEQMEALEHFIVYHNGSTNYAKDLEELRLQLKKLREE